MIDATQVTYVNLQFEALHLIEQAETILKIMAMPSRSKIEELQLYSLLSSDDVLRLTHTPEPQHLDIANEGLLNNLIEMIKRLFVKAKLAIQCCRKSFCKVNPSLVLPARAKIIERCDYWSAHPRDFKVTDYEHVRFATEYTLINNALRMIPITLEFTGSIHRHLGEMLRALNGVSFDPKEIWDEEVFYLNLTGGLKAAGFSPTISRNGQRAEKVNWSYSQSDTRFGITVSRDTQAYTFSTIAPIRNRSITETQYTDLDGLKRLVDRFIDQFCVIREDIANHIDNVSYLLTSANTFQSQTNLDANRTLALCKICRYAYILLGALEILGTSLTEIKQEFNHDLETLIGEKK